MPSTATITSFFDFTPNTKARATQVNTNFGAFRGHIIPVEPLTATSSHLSHDLGSAEHSWRFGYMQGVNFASATTTTRIVFDSDTAATAGAFRFYFSTTTAEALRVVSGGLQFPALTTTAYALLSSANATLGALSVLIGGTQVARFDTVGGSGMTHESLKARPTSANGSNPSFPAAIVVTSDAGLNSTSTSAAATDVASSTLTISTVGRPVVIGFMGNTSTGGFIRAETLGVTMGVAPEGTFYVQRSGASSEIVCRFDLRGDPSVATATVNTVGKGPGILAIDLNAPTGTSHYYMRYNVGNTNSKVVVNGRLYAFTLY